MSALSTAKLLLSCEINYYRKTTSSLHLLFQGILAIFEKQIQLTQAVCVCIYQLCVYINQIMCINTDYVYISIPISRHTNI